MDLLRGCIYDSGWGKYVMSKPNKKKTLLIFAGANGAGKTTAAEYLLPKEKFKEFVNADEIARGLSPFNPAGQQVEAGRLMLSRIHRLLKDGESFAFETTLASRSFSLLVKAAREKGYKITLYYLFTDDVRINLKRISYRVKQGGHNVPAVDVRRRYRRSLQNLFHLYWDLCDIVAIYDVSGTALKNIAVKTSDGALKITDTVLWSKIRKKGRQ